MNAKRTTIGLAIIGTMTLFASPAHVQPLSERDLSRIPFWSSGTFQNSSGSFFIGDVVSREFTVTNRSTAPIPTMDVVSRELSVLNRSTGGIEVDNAVSREFTVLNHSTEPLQTQDAISREFTALNRSTAPVAIVDVISREFSVGNEEEPFLTFADVVSREFTIYQPAPDLVISSLSGPVEILPSEPYTVAYTAVNQGDRVTEGSWTDRVYLSEDDQLGGDTLLDEFVIDDTVEAGASYSRAGFHTLPATPGLYWIFVVIDADLALDEADADDNNTSVHPVDATGIEYGATVHANISSGPAGTPVILSGQALFIASGNPAPDVEITVRVRLQGTRRVFPLTANAAGEFAFVFDPLPGEAGRYSVFADHPLVAEDPTSPQDEFILYGLQVIPNVVSERIAPSAMRDGQVTLRNLGDVQLSGITATVLSVPANLDVQVVAPDALAAAESATLSYTLESNAESVPQTLVQVDLASAEGASETFWMWVEVIPDRPEFVATPGSLDAGMLRGSRSYVEFDVLNDGAASSEPLVVAVPEVAWLSVVSPAPLIPLEPGETGTVVLELSPSIDLPLGPYTGSVSVGDAQASVTVPFRFNAISDAKGDLSVYATDEFTYWAEGEPPVVEASVTVSDLATGTAVASGQTGADGVLVIPELTEAFYEVVVQAVDHGTFRGTVFVAGGQTRFLETFLSREVVNYSWSVVPTQIEDEYQITIDALFETNVPAPVVTIDPPSFDLRLLQAESIQVDFTITNHGLIQADDVHLVIADHPQYEFTPLVSDLGDLAAQSSVVVPVVIRDKLFGGTSSAAHSAGGGCVGVSFHAVYTLICGIPRNYVIPVVFGLDNSGCGGGTWVPPPPCNGCGGGTAPIVVRTPFFSEDIPCDPCDLECLKEIGKCLIGFSPAGCPFAVASNCGSALGSIEDAVHCAVEATKGCLLGPLGPAVNALDCYKNIVPACDCGNEPFRGGGGSFFDPILTRTGDPILDYYIEHVNRVLVIVESLNEVFGDAAWFAASDPQDGAMLGPWLDEFQTATNEATDGGNRVSQAERDVLVALPLPSQLTVQHVDTFLDRWNRTLDYFDAGITSVDQVPAGQSTDFIAADRFDAIWAAGQSAQAANAAEGFDDLFGGLLNALNLLETDRRGVVVSPVSRSEPDSVAVAQVAESVCARVRIQIEQEAVITRSAFRATFELENNGDVDALDGVIVDIFIRDDAGVAADDLFGVPPPELTGLPDLDGGGSVEPGTSASAQWLIIPTSQAAPIDPKVYTVGGSLIYTINGEIVSVPLFPAPITVKPNASLDLDYFLERIVYSDDPFTPQVEPAVPFSLGLLVVNTGAGVASNMRITSAQPQIIENERGLLIDFAIVGTQVGAQAISPSLAINIGDINPSGTAIAQWLMTASLQGEFIEYNATFEHVDGLGDPRLSLISSLDIHEMNHVVRIDDPIDDGLPDFLVNDTPDLEDLPDLVFGSDGVVLVVSAVTEGSVDGPPVHGDLEVQLTATMPMGWVYLQIPEPSESRYTLLAVVRSDGRPIRLGDNVWQTHRTLHPPGEPASVENLLHLVDNDSTGRYTLTYEEFPDADQDGIPDDTDNCPNTANPDQADPDNDGFGSVCDNCPEQDNVDQIDRDRDGVGDVCDNCVTTSNQDQLDKDEDGHGEVCDNCPMTANVGQEDHDGDQVGDACDHCPFTPNTDQADFDGDQIGDVCDNCPCLDNATQDDANGNGIGDACETAMFIMASDPRNGSIEARQPTSLDATTQFGWSTVDIEMNADASQLRREDFVTTEHGGDGVAPGIARVDHVTLDTVRIVLDDRIEPGTRLVVTHLKSCSRTCLGYLPADINGDGTSAPSDILAIIDHLNGVVTPPMELWQCDTDRSDRCEPPDILRVIDLLNGAAAFDVWLGRQLPDCPVVP